MAFDRAALADAVAAHGRVARVAIAGVQGSCPRETGAAMLVWEGGQSGTIGGGALEFRAAKAAFAREGATRHALGPELGQCCGGAVTLWTETWDAASLAALDAREDVAHGVVARGPGEMPLAVRRIVDRARARGEIPAPQMVSGWFVEPLAQPRRPVWVWGAGHVGRALVSVLAPLPELALTWVDTAPTRFPREIPENVTALPAADPARALRHAPRDAAHVILTYSHALDLALCDAALRRGFGFAGVIGSRTKWARFRKRLAEMGHADAAIAAITCPIGRKDLGKHPQAIALGVAAELLSRPFQQRGVSWRNPSSASRA